MEYRFGRNEHCATVFVPWDCTNNCQFCTTKKEYTGKYNAISIDVKMEAVSNTISRVAHSPYITEFVFTGGEPLLDLERLNTLIERIGEDKKIYVNTSLTFGSCECYDKLLESSLDYLCDEHTRITSVSISCPLSVSFKWDLERWANRKFAMPFRINCVVDGNETAEEIRQFISGMYAARIFENDSMYCINFRRNYHHTDSESLKSSNDSFFRTLLSMPELEYISSSGCLVCNNDFFLSDKFRIFYHRGIENTSFVIGNRTYINDFVIKQDGEIRYDWDEGHIVTKDMEDAFCFY